MKDAASGRFFCFQRAGGQREPSAGPYGHRLQDVMPGPLPCGNSRRVLRMRTMQEHAGGILGLKFAKGSLCQCRIKRTDRVGKIGRWSLKKRAAHRCDNVVGICFQVVQQRVLLY